jgi:hypothetical protein
MAGIQSLGKTIGFYLGCSLGCYKADCLFLRLREKLGALPASVPQVQQDCCTILGLAARFFVDKVLALFSRDARRQRSLKVLRQGRLLTAHESRLMTSKDEAGVRLSPVHW